MLLKPKTRRPMTFPNGEDRFALRKINFLVFAVEMALIGFRKRQLIQNGVQLAASEKMVIGPAVAKRIEA